tara:strand:+ start:4011 stop:4508 length:498 start_codon:yes stop_codon:yes gene_type:complete
VALEFNREKYQLMVGYILENVGGVLALYTPKKGELVKNNLGKLVRPVQGTNNVEQFRDFIKKYIDNYKAYPDYPIIEYNEEKTLLIIRESFNSIAGQIKTRDRGRFYDKDEESARDIYDLKLHEELRISEMIYARRCPGGWIYSEYSHISSERLSTTFVPYIEKK